MIQWAALCLALVKGFSSLVSWLHDKDLITAGEARATVIQLRTEANAISQATKAREESRAANALVPPDRSLPDDGFRRKD